MKAPEFLKKFTKFEFIKTNTKAKETLIKGKPKKFNLQTSFLIFFALVFCIVCISIMINHKNKETKKNEVKKIAAAEEAAEQEAVKPKWYYQWVEKGTDTVGPLGKVTELEFYKDNTIKQFILTYPTVNKSYFFFRVKTKKIGEIQRNLKNSKKEGIWYLEKIKGKNQYKGWEKDFEGGMGFSELTLF